MPAAAVTSGLRVRSATLSEMPDQAAPKIAASASIPSRPRTPVAMCAPSSSASRITMNDCTASRVASVRSSPSTIAARLIGATRSLSKKPVSMSCTIWNPAPPAPASTVSESTPAVMNCTDERAG